MVFSYTMRYSIGNGCELCLILLPHQAYKANSGENLCERSMAMISNMIDLFVFMAFDMLSAPIIVLLFILGAIGWIG